MKASFALISLPGARLLELAQAVSTAIVLPVASTDGLTSWEEGTPAKIYCLASDTFETMESAAEGQRFQDAGNRVIFLDLPWEESWNAMNPQNLSDPNGLPWRAAYRHLATQRSELLRQRCDVTIATQDSFEKVREKLVEALKNERDG